MGGVARWWDGVELWSTGLTFPVQVVLVLLVVAPLCALAARGLDRIVGLVSALVARRRGPDGVRPGTERAAPGLGE